MSDETKQQITGITVGSVLLLLIVGAWGYIYRLDVAMEVNMKEMRRELREETLRQDARGEVDEHQLRKEFYEQLGFLRQEMLRLDQQNNEEVNKILARLEQMSEQFGLLRGDLKVLFSEKGHK